MRKQKLTIILGLAVLITLFTSNKVLASANADTYTIKTQEQNISTEKLINGGTVVYSKPSPVYDFFDENGNFNSVYTSEQNVYWAKFDSNMQAISTIKIKQFYDKSNSKDFLKDLLYNFGNAIYYNKHLYVVYGREANTSSSTVIADKYPTMAVVKYDKRGNIVGKLELASAENNITTDWSWGTYLPFYPMCNCSLTVNNGIIACFFGKQMFNGHQSSSVFFVDAEKMEWVSNSYYASQADKAKYKNVANYYQSHSLAQRIIPTSDGGFLMVDSADASTRGLWVTKIYKDSNGNFKKSSAKMLHYREGGTGSHGYNNTYSIVGNIIELSDGYMYIGALEKTLSRSYGQKINESWNILVQKYSKDFYTKENVESMQMLNTPVRNAVGPVSEDNGTGRLYLDGTEKDYGIKWLTDLKNEKTVIQLRAVELENDKIAIIYELLDLEKESTGGYTYTSDDGDVYYMIIDGNGNIVVKPTEIPNVDLTPEEILAYKNGKIIWTSTQNTNSSIKVNVLDLKNPKMPFTDVPIMSWYYEAVQYNYNNKMVSGVNNTTFAPYEPFTRGMLVTILFRMEGMPYVGGISKFPDVQNVKAYYYEPVKWASAKGIISGYNDGTFKPDKPITREELATILYQYCIKKGKYKTVYANYSNFTDANKISEFGKWGMNWAVGSKIISGNAGTKTLNPQGIATRAEAATMLLNYCSNIK